MIVITLRPQAKVIRGTWRGQVRPALEEITSAAMVAGVFAISNVPGPKGDTGDQGPQGIQGVQGIQGLPGIQGNPGPAGAKGDKGDQGNQGIQGNPGPAGQKGDTGDQGPQGIQGVPGVQGIEGPKGDKGDKGDQGIQGTAGENAGQSVRVQADFGAGFTDKAVIVVTGQAWVSANSNIVVEVLTPAGFDPDQMRLLDLRPVVSDLVPGTGFTLTVYCEPETTGTFDLMCIGT